MCAPAVMAEEASQPAQSATPAPATKATKEFTEDDIDKRVQEVIAERSKDGAFVFHDPRLDADLNLQFEQIKIVRGMEGYGWFANVIFHDKDEAKKQYAIDFWFKPEGDQLKLMDIRVQKGPKQEGDGWIMVTRMPVAWWCRGPPLYFRGHGLRRNQLILNAAAPVPLLWRYAVRDPE
jgi:hypothetical protein